VASLISGDLDRGRSSERRKEETIVVDKRCPPPPTSSVLFPFLSCPAEEGDGRKRIDDAAEVSEKRFEIITTFPTNKKRNGDTSVR